MLRQVRRSRAIRRVRTWLTGWSGRTERSLFLRQCLRIRRLGFESLRARSISAGPGPAFVFEKKLRPVAVSKTCQETAVGSGGSGAVTGSCEVFATICVRGGGCGVLATTEARSGAAVGRQRVSPIRWRQPQTTGSAPGPGPGACVGVSQCDLADALDGRDGPARVLSLISSSGPGT